MRPPWVPGTGVAGTIAAVGPGVDTARIGESVIARTGNEGAYAEGVAVAAAEASPIPDGLDPGVATAALHDGVLALDRLERAGLHSGSRVLITAAAGSLGQWLVPLSKTTGATVVGAAGGPTKLAAVRDLGADVAVDYREPDWIDRAGGLFDVVFDGVAGDIGSAALEATRPGGIFFGHGAASGRFADRSDDRDVKIVGIDKLDDATWRRLTTRSLDLLASGTVRPTIGLRLPLERAADAHAAIGGRSVIGKTVLEVA